MPFKQTQRVIYDRNPLFEVICQLRYPTILKIGTEPPANFQEGIRDAYPLYERTKPVLRGLDEPNLGELMAKLGIQLPALGGAETHRFLTEDKQRSVSLTTDFLAVSDKAYDRWEHFRARLVRAEEVIGTVYHPAHYARVGLRYRNIIIRSKLGLADVRWRDLISAAILGELGDPDVCDRVRATQSLTTIALTSTRGVVNIRHGLVDHEGEQCFVIDSDFSSDERQSSDECFSVLDIFNRLAGYLFRWAISARLHEAMGPRALDL
jgi:uncharacterized protein (TIGR04255 family)